MRVKPEKEQKAAGTGASTSERPKSGAPASRLPHIQIHLQYCVVPGTVTPRRNRVHRQASQLARQQKEQRNEQTKSSERAKKKRKGKIRKRRGTSRCSLKVSGQVQAEHNCMFVGVQVSCQDTSCQVAGSATRRRLMGAAMA